MSSLQVPPYAGTLNIRRRCQNELFHFENEKAQNDIGSSRWSSARADVKMKLFHFQNVFYRGQYISSASISNLTQKKQYTQNIHKNRQVYKFRIHFTVESRIIWFLNSTVK